MKTKPLILSKSWWSIAGLFLTSLAGVDWVKVVNTIASVVGGNVPPEWGPVVQLAATLLLTVLGVLGVIKRKTTIKGLM